MLVGPGDLSGLAAQRQSNIPRIFVVRNERSGHRIRCAGAWQRGIRTSRAPRSLNWMRVVWTYLD